MAPIPRKTASNPIAAGRLSVIDGNLLPCTTFADWDASTVLTKSAPHTRHRVASSFTRVPQVGQIFVGEVFDSRVIIINGLEMVPDLAHYTSFLSPNRRV
jgi:hypothetical protein